MPHPLSPPGLPSQAIIQATAVATVDMVATEVECTAAHTVACIVPACTAGPECTAGLECMAPECTVDMGAME